jgi:imidazolonepropionase-like amidohydrolase
MTPLLMASCIALLGARIFPAPGAPPIEDGAVLACDGRIAAVGKRGSVDVPAASETGFSNQFQIGGTFRF